MAHTRPATDMTLRSEELAAQKTALTGRLIALALVVPLLAVLVPWPGPLFSFTLLSLLAVLGWAAWRVQQSRWNRPIYQYMFVTADCMVVTFAVLYPNPLIPVDLPAQFAYRFGSFIFFFIILAGLAYVYRPRLVLWGGFSVALCWAIGVWLFVRMPETVWVSPLAGDPQDNVRHIGNLYFIDLSIRTQEVVVMLLVSGLLALAVARARAVALRQATLASERANLARYFPRKTADMLAERSDPFSTAREHNCAVMFADLVGFTKWSEQHDSPQTISLLRDVHGMLSEVIFRHDGTLDKFMGDGLMATFGTPDPTPRDATNALAAMTEMAQAFETWRQADTNALAQDLRLAIGVHYGPVVIGNIGSADRLEFAVLGDTVNVASRLEAATRDIGCRCLVSRALITASQHETGADVETVPHWLQHRPPMALRGRNETVEVFCLP